MSLRDVYMVVFLLATLASFMVTASLGSDDAATLDPDLTPLETANGDVRPAVNVYTHGASPPDVDADTRARLRTEAHDALFDLIRSKYGDTYHDAFGDVVRENLRVELRAALLPRVPGDFCEEVCGPRGTTINDVTSDCTWNCQNYINLHIEYKSYRPTLQRNRAKYIRDLVPVSVREALQVELRAELIDKLREVLGDDFRDKLVVILDDMKFNPVRREMKQAIHTKFCTEFCDERRAVRHDDYYKRPACQIFCEGALNAIVLE
jgi:hypothetical protein